MERGRSRVEEVLAEQLGSPDNQEHEARSESERASNLGEIAKVVLDGRVDGAERDDAEDNREARDEARRDQLQERLAEAPLAFLSGATENFGGLGATAIARSPSRRDVLNCAPAGVRVHN